MLLNPGPRTWDGEFRPTYATAVPSLDTANDTPSLNFGGFEPGKRFHTLELESALLNREGHTSPSGAVLPEIRSLFRNDPSRRNPRKLQISNPRIVTKPNP